MNRKPTKNTRGANSQEILFRGWVKEQTCICCGNWGVVAHHCMGATYKHNKTLIGHWFILPLCQFCDDVVTHGSRRKFKQTFGLQSVLWIKVINRYTEETGIEPPFEVYQAIEDCRE
jgi:hypothetical protein